MGLTKTYKITKIKHVTPEMKIHQICMLGADYVMKIIEFKCLKLCVDGLGFPIETGFHGN